VAEKDYLAVWFRARRRFGIDDTIYWGWYDPADRSIDWQAWSHADGDGLSALALQMRKIGYPSFPLPVCGETSVPGWRDIIKARKKYPIEESAKTVNWKQTYDPTSGKKFEPEITVFSKEENDLIKACSAARRVSPGNLIFAALGRVVSRELIEGDDPYYWFFPVNVRGATGIKTELSNQVSGVAMRVGPEETAEDWQLQMRQRFKAKEHWMTWKLVRISGALGERIVAWYYRKTSSKIFYAGNCSHLGVWPLPHADNPPRADHNKVLAGAAPGTMNYPVSASMIEWYGDLALTIKLHPYICNDQALVRKITDAWREEIMNDLHAEKAQAKAG